jgi:phosphomannomutase
MNVRETFFTIFANMTLISSISGIRGTIGGTPGANLTPLDALRFSMAYGTWLLKQHQSVTVVIGRDARLSGPMIQQIVQQTLIGLGINIIDLGLSTTPTVEMEVVRQNAQGGVILTASHNPKEWNALKLLNSDGEFLDASAGNQINALAQQLNSISFADVDALGTLIKEPKALDHHIDAILNLSLVDSATVAKRSFKVVVDGVNSSGGIAVPALLERMGVEVIKIHCEPNGNFPHNPEPLAKHLTDLSNAVIDNGADLGIAVDPDVDRLVFMDEKGVLFGEEYTLVACADYVLKHTPGNTVSNLSSTRALAEVTQSHGGDYAASAVGEAHVVALMKKTNAVIGGEGNGGVIYPELHYGRDALVGIALFLTQLTKENTTVSALKSKYPNWLMRKDKITLSKTTDTDALLKKIATHFSDEQVTTIDGVKVDFPQGWIHIRKSNTEPIIRIYAEAKTESELDQLVTAIETLVATD